MNTLPSEQNEPRNLSRLREILRLAKSKSPFYAEYLKEVCPDEIANYADLRKIPVLHKSEIPDLQASNKPLGGLNTINPKDFKRLFASPGGIFEAEADRPDFWRSGEFINASGLSKGDRVLNCFSYHLTPAGFMLNQGAEEAGIAVFPGGTGNSELLAGVVDQFAITAYVGTPDFLKVILTKAEESNLNFSSLKKALVSGGYLSPELKEWYAARGIESLQCFGIAELGVVAFEAKDVEGLLISENYIVETLHPVTREQLNGQKGELVVTALNPEYPLIRLATGDLTTLLPDVRFGEKTKSRIAGWQGRSDQTAKVKGMFVRPSQVLRLKSEFPAIDQIQLVIERVRDMDAMTLVFSGGEVDESLLAERLQAITNLRGALRRASGEGEFVADKLIADQREIQT